MISYIAQVVSPGPGPLVISPVENAGHVDEGVCRWSRRTIALFRAWALNISCSEYQAMCYETELSLSCTKHPQ